MARYDPARLERSTRDVVARAGYLEIMAGRGTPEGGILLDVSHLGAAAVQRQFPGMVERCRDFGMDLRREPVPVSPTAHFHMGGVAIDVDCRSNPDGLFVAGEDAGGVHGANRLGGNGVAESTVFGARAGDEAARVAGRRARREGVAATLSCLSLWGRRSYPRLWVVTTSQSPTPLWVKARRPSAREERRAAL
jgi:succinate dehydrogenase / fumarate reductase flavoprotein subunit/fumarate reductase flavoprotein subunit